jgi:SAM-dependent methyltransferase
MRRIAKAFLGRFAPSVLYWYREKRAQNGFAKPQSSNKEVFEDIYRNQRWGGDKIAPYSGSGSDDEVTKPFVEFVCEYIRANKIRSVVDLGCGDYRVGKRICQLVDEYVGVDVASTVVEHNRRLFGNDRIKFVALDITEDMLPDGELYIVRQVLQHLSNEGIKKALDKLKGRKHVIVAEHHPASTRFRSVNIDKPAGHHIRVAKGSGVYLDMPPFSFPATLRTTMPLPPLVAPGETLAVYVKSEFTDDGRAATAGDNLYAAVSLAPMMPDICGSTEDPRPAKTKD